MFTNFHSPQPCKVSCGAIWLPSNAGQWKRAILGSPSAIPNQGTDSQSVQICGTSQPATYPFLLSMKTMLKSGPRTPLMCDFLDTCEEGWAKGQSKLRFSETTMLVPVLPSAATLRLDIGVILPEYIRECIDAGYLRQNVVSLPQELVDAVSAADQYFGSYLRACSL